MLPGSASLRSLRDRLRRPPARWCGSLTATVTPGARSTSRRSCRSLIGSLKAVASLPAVVGFCSSRPPFDFGGDGPAKDFQRWPLRGERDRSPYPPAGGSPPPLPSPPPRGEGETEGGRGEKGSSPTGTDRTVRAGRPLPSTSHMTTGVLVDMWIVDVSDGGRVQEAEYRRRLDSSISPLAWSAARCSTCTHHHSST